MFRLGKRSSNAARPNSEMALARQGSRFFKGGEKKNTKISNKKEGMAVSAATESEKGSSNLSVPANDEKAAAEQRQPGEGPPQMVAKLTVVFCGDWKNPAGKTDRRAYFEKVYHTNDTQTAIDWLTKNFGVIGKMNDETDITPANVEKLLKAMVTLDSKYKDNDGLSFDSIATVQEIAYDIDGEPYTANTMYLESFGARLKEFMKKNDDNIEKLTRVIDLSSSAIRW